MKIDKLTFAVVSANCATILRSNKEQDAQMNAIEQLKVIRQTYPSARHCLSFVSQEHATPVFQYKIERTWADQYPKAPPVGIHVVL